MVSKTKIQLIRSLTHKKFRLEHQLFVIEGTKMVVELLESQWQVAQVFALPEWTESLSAELWHKSKDKIQLVTTKELEVLSQLTTANQVVALAAIPQRNWDYTQALSMPCCLALDHLQDPGNLGTIVRIADWFGISHIFCSSDCVDLYNPKTVQATMGSILRTQVYYVDLPTFFEHYPHQKVYGAMMNGNSVFTTTFAPPHCILIGNEAKGIRPQLLPYIAEHITIPKHGKAESLNAAIATGIIAGIATATLKS